MMFKAKDVIIVIMVVIVIMLMMYIYMEVWGTDEGYEYVIVNGRKVKINKAAQINSLRNNSNNGVRNSYGASPRNAPPPIKAYESYDTIMPTNRVNVSEWDINKFALN